ncbi:MAG: hypothetical protein ACUVQV_08165 [Dissulfurimicrobium sp.]|uniref:hypothetical protein n=1 Tax=Dissulfurimicrobium sp. TaxID=2022436 RepID=UPI0040495261
MHNHILRHQKGVEVVADAAAGRFVEEVTIDNQQIVQKDGARLKDNMQLLKTKINLLNSIILNCKFFQAGFKGR